MLTLIALMVATFAGFAYLFMAAVQRNPRVADWISRHFRKAPPFLRAGGGS
jgi:hypothetical protein